MGQLSVRIDFIVSLLAEESIELASELGFRSDVCHNDIASLGFTYPGWFCSRVESR